MSEVPYVEDSLSLALYYIMALSQISLALLVSVTNRPDVSLSLIASMLPVMTSMSISSPNRSATQSIREMYECSWRVFTGGLGRLGRSACLPLRNYLLRSG